MAEKYQGWTNWETWHTALLIDNEYDIYQDYVLGYSVGGGRIGWSWSVFDGGNRIAGSKITNLSKQQAINYANVYMRTH